MWQLKREKGIPIYVSIMTLILTYIQEGVLPPGEKLPSERQLAALFQVNRSTVVHALDELVALGWLIRKQGSGTLVNEGKFGIANLAPRTDWTHYLAQHAAIKTDAYSEKVAALKKQQQFQLDAYTGELPLDLIPSFMLPAMSWREVLAEEARQDDFGYQPLKQAIGQMLQTMYDFSLPTADLLITSGAQQGLFLVLQVLLKIGDSVAIEDPSFLYALPIFQAAGIRLFGVKMDAEGLSLEKLEALIYQQKIKMVFVTPSFQNPTGVFMSLARRKALVALCRRHQIPLVEDDVFAGLAFHRAAILPPLKKLDPENVLYIGSLSKILGATTKVGWLSAPTFISEQLMRGRKMMDVSLSVFPQILATKALTDPLFEAKRLQLNAALQMRATAVEQVFMRFDEWQFFPIQGGLYLWLTWQKQALKRRDWQLFLKEGLLVAPGFLFGEQMQSMRLNYTRISEQDLPLFTQQITNLTQLLRRL